MKLLRKYILWLVAATLAGIAGALLIHVSLPAHYVSTAEVDVEPNIAALNSPAAVRGISICPSGFPGAGDRAVPCSSSLS